jgi:hypothetical protein
MNSRAEYERINTYFPPYPPLPWRWIEETSKVFVSPVLKGWRHLLAGKRIPETTYTQYLANHAGYFLCPYNSFFALREIRLGSDYVTDLAIPDDRSSLGLFYTLIEVEPPYVRPFKANADKSARFSHAIDQVEKWRSWLRRHSRIARELFPCWWDDPEPQFEFTIIIGTRENTKPWIPRRNEISAEYRISIRTHDHLTDNLVHRDFGWNERRSLSGSEGRNVSPIIANALGNPFFKAWSDLEWKRIREEIAPSGHFFVWNADSIIKNRQYNKLFVRFVRYCKRRLDKFPLPIKDLYERWQSRRPLRPDLRF